MGSIYLKTKRNIVKDFLNNELKEGDRVVCAVSHHKNAGASLVIGRIIRFTIKMLVVERTDYYTNVPVKERKILPQKTVKIK